MAEGAGRLNKARADLAAQVASGAISQAQADAELNRISSQMGTNPNMQGAWGDLQKQVDSGAITQAQMDAELGRLGGIYGTAKPGQPNPGGVNNPAQQAGTDDVWNKLLGKVASGEMTQEQAAAKYNTKVGGAGAPYTDPGLKLDTPSDVINTTFGVGQSGAMQGNLLTNANQYSPFGNQTVTIDPITGQPTVTQGLSKGQGGVVKGIEGSSQAASGALQSLLGGGVFGSLTNPAGAGGPGPGSNFEEAVFQQLTKGVDTKKKQEQDQLSQELANRGIPVGSDLYNNQMQEFNTRYDDIYQNAKSQAVTGGISSALQGIGTLSNVGNAGFFNPNYSPFQSVGYQQPDVGNIFNTIAQQDIANKQLQFQQQQYADQKKMMSGGGGGGGGNSGGGGGFVTGPPPGS